MSEENREIYLSAYLAGYMKALQEKQEEQRTAYVDVDGIMKRYGIGINAARDVLKGVRHVCNGGKLNSSSKVLVAELEYWESLVDTRFKERL